jgi:TonB family protein
MMLRLSSTSRFTAVAVCLFVVGAIAEAQSTPSAGTPETGVILTKLSPPVYPPLARQARIMGDVKVQIQVRKDGGVESVELLSRHPILKEAALESARTSTFECRRCGEELTTEVLTFVFELRDNGDCCNLHSRSSIPPEVTTSQARVTIAADPWCICDPGAEIQKGRSAKCLYLWKCGRR